MRDILILVFFIFLISGCNNTKSSTASAPIPLSGSWELFYITGPRISFDGLYPGKKPFMNFDTAAKRVSGNTGCNRFSGPYENEGNRLLFKDPMIMTKMMCASGAEGETVFVNLLKKVSQFTLQSDTLILSDVNNIELMKLTKSAGTDKNN